MPDLRIFRARKRAQVENVCDIGSEYRLHSGVWGQMEEWYKTPEVFETMTLATLDDEPVGIAAELSHPISDPFFVCNTTIFVRPAYRRQGIGTELIGELRKVSTKRLYGFTGEFQPNKFWVRVGADGRYLRTIKEHADHLGTTPYKLGYFNFPKVVPDEHA